MAESTHAPRPQGPQSPTASRGPSPGSTTRAPVPTPPVAPAARSGTPAAGAPRQPVGATGSTGPRAAPPAAARASAATIAEAKHATPLPGAAIVAALAPAELPGRATLTAPSGEGASIERVLDAVFITPRVVDQRVLEDFGTSLRALVREAASQQASLAAAANDVRAALDAAHRAGADLRQAMLTAKAEGPRPGPAPAGIEPAALAALVREQVAKALREAGVGTPRTAAGSAQAVPSPIAPPSSVAASPGEEAIERATRAATSLDRATDEALVRVAGLREQVEAARARAELAQRSLDDSAAAAEVRVAAAAANAERMLVELSERSGEASTRLGAALSQADRRVAAASTDLEARLADFERRAGLIAARATERIASGPAPIAASTGDGPEQARGRLSAQMIAAGEALDALAARAQAIRAQAGAGLPELDARAAGLRESIAQATRVGDALAALVEQARGVGDALDRLRRQP